MEKQETPECKTEVFVLSGQTRLSQALKNIPGALEYIVSLNPHDFTRLHNAFMRRYMSPRISLQRVAAMAEIPTQQLLEGLSALKEDSVVESTLDDKKRDSSIAKSPVQAPSWMAGVNPKNVHHVSVLPIDDVLGDPFPPISVAFKWMQPGEVILLLHRWEPQPLYDIWQKIKLEWFTQEINSQEWHTYIHKPESFPAPTRPAVLMTAVGHLSEAEIPPRIVAMFEQLATGQEMRVFGFTSSDEERIENTMREKFPEKYEWERTEATAGTPVKRPMIFIRTKSLRTRALPSRNS